MTNTSHRGRNGSSEQRHVSSERLLTPRTVERRYPALSRQILAKRRALKLPPEYEVASGCVMYPEQEIERFLAMHAKAISALGGSNGLQSIWRAQ